MIILGIDPGTAITGYGVVEQVGGKFKPIDYGAIRTKEDLTLAQRLEIIYNRVEELIIVHQPDEFALEDLFFNKNVKTALAVAHARGVIMLGAVNKGLEVYNYTPLQVKQAVVGYGRAEKSQVQYMVKTLLNLPQTPKPDDVADALAVAICHGNSYNYHHKMARMEKLK